ncbi:MAG: hypothetical protein R2867_23495 [Caldilineaceae bacterium]
MDAFAGNESTYVYDRPPISKLAFRLTALGEWLLETTTAQAPAWQWQRAATLTVADDHLLIVLSTAAPPLAQAYISAFGRHQAFTSGPQRGQNQSPARHGYHTYRFDQASLAAATTEQVSPLLWDAFDQLELAPSITCFGTHTRMVWLGGTNRPVAASAATNNNTSLMAALQQHPAIRGYLGEVLASTVAVWLGDVNQLPTTLRRRGFYAQRTAWDDHLPPDVAVISDLPLTKPTASAFGTVSPGQCCGGQFG